MVEVSQLIDLVLGTLLGGGSAALIFYPQIKKQKELENKSQELLNEAKESEGWRNLCEHYQKQLADKDEQLEAKDGKIDELYGVISKHRDEKAELREKLAVTEIENTKLKILKCNVPGCPKREPPTGY